MTHFPLITGSFFPRSATRRRYVPVAVILASFLAAAATPALAADPLATCLAKSGIAGAKCLIKGTKALAELIDPPDNRLRDITAKAGEQALKKCTIDDAKLLGYRDLAELSARIKESCDLFAYDLNALVYTVDQGGLTDAQKECRSSMYKSLSKLQKKVTTFWGKKCTAAEYLGKGCDRTKRDIRIAKTRAKTETVINKKCGADFDAVNTFDGATLADRIASFVEIGVVRGRHWSERVFPPNNMGPSAELGPFQVGLTTLALEDISRLNVAMDGPRPVVTEVYYPTTDAAIVGVDPEVVEVVGITLFPISAYRDVALEGTNLPVVLFSHGNLGIRTQSFFFAQVLASHGFIVLSPDHHGNTFVEPIVDPDVATNRPLDMSFIIDELEAMNVDAGNFFEGAFDLNKIGVSGHSFGGYTTLALGGNDFGLGAFTDTRVKALFPQAPASSADFFGPGFFEAITVPTLIVGGTIDETTPFDPHQQYAFDSLLSGASVVGLAEIVNAGHFTFSSFCEVPTALLAFLGGFEEACEPRHLPWRHAQDITMYLGHNFFDATLNGNAAALARLDPGVIAGFDTEDIVYQSK